MGTMVVGNGTLCGRILGDGIGCCTLLEYDTGLAVHGGPGRHHLLH